MQNKPTKRATQAELAARRKRAVASRRERTTLLSKDALRLYRERAYNHLVAHQSLTKAIIDLVQVGCPLATAGAVVDWVVLHSFGNMVVN